MPIIEGIQLLIMIVWFALWYADHETARRQRLQAKWNQEQEAAMPCWMH